MGGFTPGPWITDPETEHQCVLGPDGYMVADCAIFGFGPIAEARPNSVCEANARLIAAAPEMYEALKQARDLFEDDEGIYAVIDAALSKAEGLSNG